MDIFERLVDYKNKGIACMVVTVIEKNGEGPVTVGKKMLITETDEAFGTVGGGAVEYESRNHCKDLIREQKNDLITYLFNEGKIVEDTTTLPMACGGKATLFFEYIGVKAYVYIFGAGHVGQALSKVLKTMNYHLTVVDYREEVIEAFTGADKKCHRDFTDFIDEEGIREDSYVIVCTPSHKYDYDVIDRVLTLACKPKYVGMLCSQTKLMDYMARMHEKLGRDIDLSNFYSPIGLDTGGGSPAEIAISIAAEILAVSHDKKGHKHMRGDD